MQFWKEKKKTPAAAKKCIIFARARWFIHFNQQICQKRWEQQITHTKFLRGCVQRVWSCNWKGWFRLSDFWYMFVKIRRSGFLKFMVIFFFQFCSHDFFLARELCFSYTLNMATMRSFLMRVYCILILFSTITYVTWPYRLWILPWICFSFVDKISFRIERDNEIA